jgi:hypothetical protein
MLADDGHARGTTVLRKDDNEQMLKLPPPPRLGPGRDVASRPVRAAP